MTGDRVAGIRGRVESGMTDAELMYHTERDLAYLLAENARLRAQLDTALELAERGADEYHYRTLIGARGGVMVLGEGYVRVSDLRAALNQGGDHV